jgi:hypothetical protein
VRPAAWVSEVIFSSTVPVTVLPWLFHWTLSPRLGFLAHAGGIPIDAESIQPRFRCLKRRSA